MSTDTVLKSSPSKLGPGSTPRPPQRKVEPSPERQCPQSTTVILPRERADEAGLQVSPLQPSYSDPEWKAGNGEQVLGKSNTSDGF
jgi:hypothetical protein